MISDFNDLDLALQAHGFEKENHEPKVSGSGSTAVWTYKKEDEKKKIKIVVSVTPKYTLLKLLGAD